MMETLIIAAAVALAATLLLSGLVLVFDAFAPARFVRERHDFGLAVVLSLPLVFALACLPSPGGQVSSVPEYRIVLPDADALFGLAQPARFADAAPSLGGRTPQVGFAWRLPPSLINILLALWAGGTVLGAARLALDLRALARLKARAQPVAVPAGLKLSKPVAMARTEAVKLPLLAGFLRPTILLPADFVLDRDARPVLEHEIAHVIRHDAWTALATRLLTTVFWWAFPLRPLLPVIDRAREVLCDRRAARITGAPRQLASALLDAAEIAVRTPSLTLAAAPARSSLAGRIGLLTDPESLNRKDSLMRLSLILPAMIGASLVLTPNIGAAPASDARLSSPASESGRRLDDAHDLDASLFLAARRGHIAQLSDLLESGADPDARFSGDGTALIAAARARNGAAVHLLLEAGADPDLESAGDGNPLIAAAKGGDRAIVGLLLEAGADVNAYVPGDETPLINAAHRGDLEMAELLVEAGADVSLTVLAGQRDGQAVYRSPLSEARRTGQNRMIRWLEAHGARHQPPA